MHATGANGGDRVLFKKKPKQTTCFLFLQTTPSPRRQQISLICARLSPGVVVDAASGIY